MESILHPFPILSKSLAPSAPFRGHSSSAVKEIPHPRHPCHPSNQRDLRADAFSLRSLWSIHLWLRLAALRSFAANPSGSTLPLLKFAKKLVTCPCGEYS